MTGSSSYLQPVKHPPPRIGILTFHNGPNYGGFLQAWHLRNAIVQLGYRCDVVNYLHPAHRKANQVSYPIRSIASLKTFIHWSLKRWPFRDIEQQLCSDPFTDDVNKVPWSSFDAIVVGSDVIWDFQNSHFGHDPVYFGEVEGLRELPIMSYAASTGSAVVDEDLPDYCNGLKRFTRLSFRGEPTDRLVKRVTGIDPQLVVDPTWLHPDPEVKWLRSPRRPYVLVYGNALTSASARQLKDWCRERSLLLIAAATPCASADRVYRMLSPFQWVDLFRNASATVVGSLHGTMYSIKYRKPFIVAKNGGTELKISSALERCGLTHRLIPQQQIDNTSFALLDPALHPLPEIPEAWRLESLQFLKTGITCTLESLPR